MTGTEQEVFEWTPAFAVNIPEIDGEHRIWFGLVESLHQAMRAGEGRQKLQNLLAQMLRYTREHFSHEEQMMADASFPELVAHRAEHAGLTRMTNSFQERFERGENTITIELMQFLMIWIRRHTTTSDLRFGDYLKGRPASAPGDAPGVNAGHP